jgi:hypothetical protein
MRSPSARLSWVVLFVLGACEHADVRAVVYETLSQVEVSRPAEHYRQLAQRGDVILDLGCFVVQRRQSNCFDASSDGHPNFHLAVVECACPCTDEEPDPCDATRAHVRSGTIRGLVDEEGGTATSGGVEIPTNVDLADATWLFVTREPNDTTGVAASGDVVIGGALVPEGAVLRGELASPTRQPARGHVTVVPARDEVSL